MNIESFPIEKVLEDEASRITLSNFLFILLNKKNLEKYNVIILKLLKEGIASENR